MDSSFELLSTMSPKVKKTTKKRVKNKGPAILSLRSGMRRSVIFDKMEHPRNESIIIVEESSVETVDTSIFNSDSKNENLIIISDSDKSGVEDSCIEQDSCMRLTETNLQKVKSSTSTKHLTIEDWISSVTVEHDSKKSSDDVLDKLLEKYKTDLHVKKLTKDNDESLKNTYTANVMNVKNVIETQNKLVNYCVQTDNYCKRVGEDIKHRATDEWISSLSVVKESSKVQSKRFSELSFENDYKNELIKGNNRPVKGYSPTLQKEVFKTAPENNSPDVFEELLRKYRDNTSSNKLDNKIKCSDNFKELFESLENEFSLNTSVINKVNRRKKVCRKNEQSDLNASLSGLCIEDSFIVHSDDLPIPVSKPTSTLFEREFNIKPSVDIKLSPKFTKSSLDKCILEEKSCAGSNKPELGLTSATKITQNKGRDLNSSPSDEELSNCEDVLNKIYGDSWKKKNLDILPRSESRTKNKHKISNDWLPKTESKIKPKVSLLYKNPYTDTERNKSSDILKSVHSSRIKSSAQDSPWSKALRKLCDSDTSSPKNKQDSPWPTKICDSDASSSKRSNNVGRKSRMKLDFQDNEADEFFSAKSELSDVPLKAECPFSFLASLSICVPASQCEPSAKLFRNHFKTYKDELLKRLFKLYNDNIFNNALPDDTLLEWNDRMRGTAGYCYCKKITRRTGKIERAARIVLATKVIDSADRLRDTLVHELCHAATWIVNGIADGHGAFWKSWAQKAMRVFPELPPIKRCHDYIINTKYTYRCTSCGYSIGRHSKSLNIERKRCGYCYGKFTVFVNKTTKSGVTKSVPSTPRRQVTGFALFVKENYAEFKTPQLDHANVMKLLSQKFAEVKVTKEKPQP